MRSTVTVAANVLATHYVDLASADAEARVAERLRDTGLLIFDGLAGRSSLLAFATRSPPTGHAWTSPGPSTC